jgi:hypothetical protein
MTTDFNSIAANIESLLEQEEMLPEVAGRIDLEQRYQRRDKIASHLKTMSDAVQGLQTLLKRLPALAPIGFVEWAEAVLQLPNLAFVVLDTTGVQSDSDIIRVLVADHTGKTIYARVIQPQRQHGQANTYYTGIRQQDIEESPALTEAWGEIQKELTGKFVLAYNLDFVQQRISENAKAYGLPGLHLVGDCLQHTAEQYFFRDSRAISLVAACERIGHRVIVPTYAEERATGQLALLQAMAQGITQVQAESDVPKDDHPF